MPSSAINDEGPGEACGEGDFDLEVFGRTGRTIYVCFFLCEIPTQVARRHIIPHGTAPHHTTPNHTAPQLVGPLLLMSSRTASKCDTHQHALTCCLICLFSQCFYQNIHFALLLVTLNRVMATLL